MCSLAVKFKDDLKAIKTEQRALFGERLDESTEFISKARHDHKNDIADHKNEHALALAAEEDKNTELRGQLTNEKTQKKKVEGLLSVEEAKTAALEKEKAQLVTEIAELTGRMTAETSQKKIVEKRLSAEKSKTAAQEKEKAQLVTEIAELTGRLTAEKSQKKTVEGLLSAEKTKTATLEQERAKLGTTLQAEKTKSQKLGE